jgi:hypothetical protein
MERPEIHLNPLFFANVGHEKSDGEYTSDDRALFSSIRSVCPELSEWGDLPIGVAWGSYSQDVYLLSWLDQEQITLSRDNLIKFLAYIRWHDVKGEPQWSITPEELDNFAKEQSIFLCLDE